MNVHHLELFYYVARHGGISSAVRQMPYGIQQPAVSAQILRLERDLEVKLFERQPFRLTAAGQELLTFVEPFFSNLEDVARRLRNGALPQLRLVASEVILRTHFPAVLDRLRSSVPRVRLALRSGFDVELAAWLRDGEADLAITPLHGRPPTGTQSMSLLRLPLVLLVPKKWKTRSADEILAQRRPEQPLISMPARESVTVIFQRGLRKRGIDWPVSIEASSLHVVTDYVAQGLGAGATVMLRELVENPKVRALPLPNFETMEVAALWRGEVSPVLRAILDECQRYARDIFPDAAVDPVAGSDAAEPAAPRGRRSRRVLV
jgi:DNA-binding transcriptional LysR family regulator